SEVKLGSCSKSVLSVPHEVQVAIHRENLFLRIEPLELNGEHRFLNFSPERSFGCEEQILGQLLSQCAAAFNDTAGHDILQPRSRNAVEIDAPVCEEILIFHRSDCISHHLRYLVPCNEDPTLQGKAPNDLTLVRIHFRDKARMVLL